jgi:hypothetical protein
MRSRATTFPRRSIGLWLGIFLRKQSESVRAAPEDKRGAIFEASNKQMERLDEAAKRQLKALRKSLRLEMEN